MIMWLNLYTENEVNTLVNQWTLELNWENSDIIDKFIMQGKGLNLLITTDQYEYIYIITDTIFLSQVDKLHDVWLLNMTQYKNFTVLKINTRKSISELSRKLNIFRSH